MNKEIWAIGLNYGYEGCRPPLTFCETEAEARQLAKLVQEANGTAVYVARVPAWPELSGDLQFVRVDELIFAQRNLKDGTPS